MVKKSVVRQFVALLLVEVLVAQPIQPLRHPLFPVAEAEPASSDALLPATPSEPIADAPQSNAVIAAADASALDVFVGFADSSSASANYPTPWQGSPNVVYLGGGTPVDAGAIRLDNTSGVPIAIDSVSVDLQRANAQFSLWQNFTIPARGSAVLTQTQPGNFDTSAYPIVQCGGTLDAGETRIPKITVTIAGTPASFIDTAHVLDTGGFDLSCRGNESLQWRHIGTTGIDSAGGHLTLAPAAISGSGGSPITLGAQLSDPNGTPIANA
ncbi:MAG TPA: hypothetical protein VKL19_05680, partial [Thermoanaerobaculia bacterium]|nr:hypothetical protein [Thermoanaerobaculia bacterium]